MTDANELKEEAQSVAWWLADENKEARKELEERRPQLGMWLQMIERKVNERLAQVENEAKIKA